MSKIAKMRQRVTFQKPTPGVDDGGFPNAGYTIYATCWAEVTGGTTTRITGKEMLGADSVLSENQLMVTIRYREDITPDMQMVHKGQPYAIVAVTDKDGMQVWTDLLVKGWQNGGV